MITSRPNGENTPGDTESLYDTPPISPVDRSVVVIIEEEKQAAPEQKDVEEEPEFFDMEEFSCNSCFQKVCSCFDASISMPSEWSIFSGFSSIPTAVNAMLGIYSGWSAAKWGQDPLGWWDSMPTWAGIVSGLAGYCSWDVNTDQAKYFVPRAFEKVKNDLANLSEDTAKKLISMALGSGAAIAQSIIAYESFAWLGVAGAGWAIGVGAVFGVITFITYAASRTNGVERCFDLISDLFSRTGQLKSGLVAALKHLDQDQQATLLDELKLDHLPELPKDPTEEQQQAYDHECEALLESLRVSFRNHPEWCRNDTWLETGGRLFDFALAALVAITSGNIFFQKSLDGVALFVGEVALANSPLFLRIMIGSLGLISSFLYFISALNIREAICSGLKNDTWNTLLSLLKNGIACFSMKTVVNGIISNPRNFFGLSRVSTYGAFLPLLGALDALMTNLSSSLGLRAIELAANAEAHDPTVGDLTKWIATKKHFTDEETSHLHRTVSFFKELSQESVQDLPQDPVMEALLNPNI